MKLRDRARTAFLAHHARDGRFLVSKKGTSGLKPEAPLLPHASMRFHKNNQNKRTAFGTLKEYSASPGKMQAKIIRPADLFCLSVTIHGPS
jgi:hypothetical protein